MAFNADAVNALFAAIVSVPQQLGTFEVVMAHEPKNAPVALPACAVWVQTIKAVRSSGLASVSGCVSMRARIYQSTMLAEPQDGIDPALLANTSLLLGALSDGFTLGGTVREVDLLGAEGEALAAETGFINHDNRLFRVAEIVIPVVINDLWTEAA
jgi:hypothetical protein